MRAMLIGAAIVLAVAPLSAQQPPGPGRVALRQAVVQRFVQNFSQQAGLDDEQRQRFQQALQGQFETRQVMARRRMELLRAFEDQMRPGVAAETDSITALLESMVQLEEESAAATRSEQETYAEFLSPIQRGLLVIHYERFQRQIQGIQRRPGAPRRNNRSGFPGN